jgi:hypothetical protein
MAMGSQAVSLLQASDALLNSKRGSENESAEKEQKALFAYQRATLMFKCFRWDDAADPQTFIDAAASILADYDDDIIELVTDPRTGIPTKQKWPPQPQEVKSACDAIHLPRAARQEKEKKIREQLEERAALEALPPPKQTYEEFVAEMKSRGLPIDGRKFKPDQDSVEAIRKRYNISEEQWNAIPDLPPANPDYWLGVRRIKS